MRGARTIKPAFTLIELLVVIAIIAILFGLIAPQLAGARSSARQVACSSNLRQLAIAWTMYADAHAGRVMPLAYFEQRDIGAGDRVFWWGADGSVTGRIDHNRGFIAPYLDDALHERSVYECPAEPWGNYRTQTRTGEITSTYGYNGYYLSPVKTPGWHLEIGSQLWKRMSVIEDPSSLFIFADTLLPGRPPSNNALLDPPMLFTGSRWKPNRSPTTAFRHFENQTSGVVITARADASVQAVRSRADWLIESSRRIGSVGTANDPHYVPDWERWK
ncbi:MAG: type II secretion system protein [Phycisphaerales bacterium JB039]